MHSLDLRLEVTCISGRILAGCYWFCILILVSSYTANLAAFFTVKNAEHPIHNLEDVVKSSYQVGVFDSSSAYEVLKTSQYETHKRIWHRIQEEDTAVHSLDEMLQLVREREEAVFIADGPMLRHIANEPPCDLATGNETNRSYSTTVPGSNLNYKLVS